VNGVRKPGQCDDHAKRSSLRVHRLCHNRTTPGTTNSNCTASCAKNSILGKRIAHPRWLSGDHHSADYTRSSEQEEQDRYRSRAVRGKEKSGNAKRRVLSDLLKLLPFNLNSLAIFDAIIDLFICLNSFAASVQIW